MAIIRNHDRSSLQLQETLAAARVGDAGSRHPAAVRASVHPAQVQRTWLVSARNADAPGADLIQVEKWD